MLYGHPGVDIMRVSANSQHGAVRDTPSIGRTAIRAEAGRHVLTRSAGQTIGGSNPCLAGRTALTSSDLPAGDQANRPCQRPGHDVASPTERRDRAGEMVPIC